MKIIMNFFKVGLRGGKKIGLFSAWLILFSMCNSSSLLFSLVRNTKSLTTSNAIGVINNSSLNSQHLTSYEEGLHIYCSALQNRHYSDCLSIIHPQAKVIRDKGEFEKHKISLDSKKDGLDDKCTVEDFLEKRKGCF